MLNKITLILLILIPSMQAGRWYDPGVGRFLNQDPIGVNGGINVYNSMSNNMVNGFVAVANDSSRSKQNEIIQKTILGTHSLDFKSRIPFSRQVRIFELPDGPKTWSRGMSLNAGELTIGLGVDPYGFEHFKVEKNSIVIVVGHHYFNNQYDGVQRATFTIEDRSSSFAYIIACSSNHANTLVNPNLLPGINLGKYGSQLISPWTAGRLVDKQVLPAAVDKANEILKKDKKVCEVEISLENYNLDYLERGRFNRGFGHGHWPIQNFFNIMEWDLTVTRDGIED